MKKTKKMPKDHPMMWEWCDCWGMYHRWRFPTFATIALAIGIFWLLNSLGIIKGNIPWWPIILIVVALGWIVNGIVSRCCCR